MSSDLGTLFSAQDQTRRWRAEVENATARLELSLHNERMAFLLSQHEPVASMGVDRERLRLLLGYIKHGDINRLNREFAELQETQKEPQ